MNLNLACGGNKLEGFENHDTDVDLRKPLPWEEGTIDFILLEHGLEHFSAPEALSILDECERILKPGGTLRLCCPVIGPHLIIEHTRSLIREHGHLIVLNEDLMRTLLWAAGFSLNQIQRTDRKDCDGHFRVIGKELDDLETVRLEARKL